MKQIFKVVEVCYSADTTEWTVEKLRKTMEDKGYIVKDFKISSREKAQIIILFESNEENNPKDSL